MGYHHFFTSPELIGDDHVSLAGEEAYHAARVLRVRTGETITIADGTGTMVEAVVTSASEDIVEARIVATQHHVLPRPRLVLCQALARKERMDLVVQKAVEVGVARIVPYAAERSVIQWDGAKRAKARGRWLEIARAAAKQSRSPWLAEVTDLRDGVDELDWSATAVLLHSDAGVRLRDALPGAPPEEIALVVGPEGGLSPEELASMETRGGVAATLGERILRTETAGPVALALTAYAYGLLG